MPKEKVNYQEVYDLNYDKFMNSNWNLHLRSRS